MTSSAYYRPSGSSSPLALPVALVVAGPAAVALAFLYAYATLYIPIAGYVSFILAGGFGVLLGVCARFALKLGKVRSLIYGAVLSSLIGLIGFYAQWAAWCAALLTRGDVEVSFLALWLSPGALWELMGRIAENGAWELFHFTPTGWLLWTIWFVEALFILVPAVFLGISMVTEPFCERCARWCREEQAVARLGPSPEGGVRARAEAKDFAALAALGSVGADAAAQLRVDLFSCAGCRETYALSIHAVERSIDEKGKASESSSALVEHLLLTPQEFDQVRTLGQSSAAG
jgi:hypothetical protein